MTTCASLLRSVGASAACRSPSTRRAVSLGSAPSTSAFWATSSARPRAWLSLLQQRRRPLAPTSTLLRRRDCLVRRGIRSPCPCMRRLSCACNTSRSGRIHTAHAAVLPGAILLLPDFSRHGDGAVLLRHPAAARRAARVAGIAFRRAQRSRRQLLRRRPVLLTPLCRAPSLGYGLAFVAVCGACGGSRSSVVCGGQRALIAEDVVGRGVPGSFPCACQARTWITIPVPYLHFFDYRLDRFC